MMDAEQRLHLSMRSERQQRLEIRPDWHPVGQMRNEGRNGRRLKQAADRYLNIKAGTDPADQTRRKQRVATKRKEVVVNPNPIDPENLRKQGAQQLLLRTARQTTNRRPKLRRRKRRAVKLPVRRQRKTIQNNDRRRHHVLGKPRTNMRSQLTSVRRTTRSQNNVADKLGTPRAPRARDNRSLRYTTMPQQRRLDLPRLNAKSADLHLLVRATHKLQHSIPAPARKIPAAVHPAARSSKPVRNKALPSQTTTAQITARNTSPRYVKLPNYPNRHWLQTTIQYVHTRVPYRTTNRNTRWNTTALTTSIRGRPDATLSRAILINQRQLWEKLVVPNC